MMDFDSRGWRMQKAESCCENLCSHGACSAVETGVSTIALFLMQLLVVATLMNSTVASAKIIKLTPSDQIQKAIDDAASGDVIYLAPGVYKGAGNQNVSFKGKNIVLKSQGGPKDVAIDLQGSARAFKFTDGETLSATIDGITIRNGHSGVENGGAIYCANSGYTIRNSYFEKNHAWVNWDNRVMGGAIYNEKCKTTIVDSRFDSNEAPVGGSAIYNTASDVNITRTLFTSNLGYALANDNSSTVVVRNSTFKKNTGYGAVQNWRSKLYVYNSLFTGNSGCYPFHNFFQSTLTLVNSTLFGNIASGSGCSGSGVLVGSESIADIVNTIIWGNKIGSNSLSPKQINVGAKSKVNISFSAVETGVGGAKGVLVDSTAVINEHHNSDANPKFVNANGGDFRLDGSAPRSPLINAGTPIPELFTDIRGSVRPVDGSFDIGAYEFSSNWGDCLDCKVAAFHEARTSSSLLKIGTEYQLSWKHKLPFPESDSRLSPQFLVSVSLTNEFGQLVEILSGVPIPGNAHDHSVAFTPTTAQNGKGWRLRVELTNDRTQFYETAETIEINANVAKSTEIGKPIPTPDRVNLNIHTPTPNPSVFWHAASKTLYAIRTGATTVKWKDASGNTIETVEWNVIWPSSVSQYQLHVAQSPPVDISATGKYKRVELLEAESTTGLNADAVRNTKQFVAEGAGRSLLMYSDGDSPVDSPVTFQLVKTIVWNDSNYLHSGAGAIVGEEINDTFGYHDDKCGSPYVFNETSRYWPETYDRSVRSGRIIGVNKDSATTESDDFAIIYYHQHANGICWPQKAVRYELSWPANPSKIVIASMNGSGMIDPDVYKDWAIYYQNDISKPGFNPNEEHAIVKPALGTQNGVFALRDDLNSEKTSEPYVLVKYKDPNRENALALKVFSVVAEEEPYFFRYAGTAGTLIQAPYPLSLLRTPDAELMDKTSGVSGPFWKDRKAQFWARAAGNDGGFAAIVMRYFYPTQQGFYFPDRDEQPTIGTYVPWLDIRAGTLGTPINVTYQVSWPDGVPTLLAGETLVKQKRGLPNVDGQCNVAVIYEQTVAQGKGQGITLFDGRRQRDVVMSSVPPDIKTDRRGPYVIFVELPPHLRDRIVFDKDNAKLRLLGEFVEPVAGDAYLLLNMLSAKDKDVLVALSGDPVYRSAIEELYVKTRQTLPVDPVSESKALNAHLDNPGGFVSLAFGNDEAACGKDSPVSINIIQTSAKWYKGELKAISPECPFDEKLTLRHSGDFAGNTDRLTFEWRTYPDNNNGVPPATPIDQWSVYETGVGRVSTTLAGAGLFTLSDNWFVARYCDTSTSQCDDPDQARWSEWTEPQLAEGWIKRVLADINPFEQKFSSYRDHTVNTVVSMISQAGPRWNGDVPLSCRNLDDFGLIELYQTVLGRGRKLSIDGSPPVSYAPGNNALLLAASRIADLYLLLGNEAYADASDPTIAFGTEDAQYGNVASSIHVFMNQSDSLLQEELELLRGRDDTRSPGVLVPPVYNRLFWNFTRDISGGEVAYALNYNIQDDAGKPDGKISEADAKALYPQGHGDAWGHYLTAAKAYYQLIRHPTYTWIPRAETVLVGGVPVTVDYLDERKFAKAAAARAQVGAEIASLTFRYNYAGDSVAQLRGYKDTRAERAWGLTEWTSRAGQGAFFDWVVGNAILPPEDNEHTGIAKVDRETTLELRQIASAFDDVQLQIDKSDSGLNPLGIGQNVIPFDIDPAGIANGQTHFEQIYNRAVVAMNNAITVFNFASNNSQMLRRQADSSTDFQRAVVDREADFNNRLIEIFGYPYGDDIGPAGTYQTGYQGPDIYHFEYVDQSELMLENPPRTYVYQQSMKEFEIADNGALTQQSKAVQFTISTMGFGMIKPASWTAPRRAIGELQMARSEILQSKARFERALSEYNNLLLQVETQAALLGEQYNLNATEISILNAANDKQQSLNTAIARSRERQMDFRNRARIATIAANAIAEALPRVAGMSVDATSTARSAIMLAGSIVSEVLGQNADTESLAELDHQQAKEMAQAQTNIKLTSLRQEIGIKQLLAQIEQLIRNEASLRLELYSLQEAMQQAAGRYRAALARGDRLLDDRLRFRQQTAAQVQDYRYKDMAFRIFRNDALQKYRAQFDMAATYVYLAAKAYDYETNLLGDDASGSGHKFLANIVRQRAIGQISDGQPSTGAGLADPMARMKRNWDQVLKGRLGFNNPQTETGRFSLRSELFRIGYGVDANAKWRDTLRGYVVENILDIPEFKRYARIFNPHENVEPGIVIPFETNIHFGLNLFGWPLGGGDSSYDSSHFATKIRSVGVWFSNYNNVGGGMSNTPRVYLLPVGSDVLRSPTSSSGATREWRIQEQTLPVPLPISAADLVNTVNWIPEIDTLGAQYGNSRTHASFRAFHDSGSFTATEMTSESRLIGRSVWNTRWMLVIPAGALHSNRREGLDRFVFGAQLPDGTRDGNGVSDIKMFFQTYSYSGE